MATNARISRWNTVWFRCVSHVAHHDLRPIEAERRAPTPPNYPVFSLMCGLLFPPMAQERKRALCPRRTRPNPTAREDLIAGRAPFFLRWTRPEEEYGRRSEDRGGAGLLREQQAGAAMDHWQPPRHWWDPLRHPCPAPQVVVGLQALRFSSYAPP